MTSAMTRPKTRIQAGTALVVTIALLTLGGVACGGQDDAASGETVDVSLRDFELTVSPDSATPGSVTLQATNDGPTTHEFELFSGAEDVDLNSLPIENDVADTTGLDARRRGRGRDAGLHGRGGGRSGGGDVRHRLQPARALRAGHARDPHRLLRVVGASAPDRTQPRPVTLSSPGRPATTTSGRPGATLRS